MKTTIYLMLCLFMIACNKQSDQKVEEKATVQDNTVQLTKEQYAKAGIAIGEVMDTVLSGTIHVHGRIDVPPQNLASISVPMGGFLRSTKLLPGMKVRKGESIAVLEDQQYIQLQEDYLTTKAKLAQAEADYLRQKDLSEAKAGSEKVFEKAKAEYQTLSVMLNSLGQKLRMIYINPQSLNEKTISRTISIPAPFSGFVTKVMVNIGKYVTPSDILFEMVNPDDIHLNLKVFEKDLMQLSIGLPLMAFVNSKPEIKHECEILLISNAIAEDGTAEVHCHFKDYDHSLVPGMFMNADIELNKHRVFALPEKAVTEFENKSYVFVQQGKTTFTMIEVKTGAKENEMVEIVEAEQLRGKNIVVSGAYTLLMSLKNVE